MKMAKKIKKMVFLGLLVVSLLLMAGCDLPVNEEHLDAYLLEKGQDPASFRSSVNALNRLSGEIEGYLSGLGEREESARARLEELTTKSMDADSQKAIGELGVKIEQILAGAFESDLVDDLAFTELYADTMIEVLVLAEQVRVVTENAIDQVKAEFGPIDPVEGFGVVLPRSVLEITIGNLIAYINNVAINMDVAPLILEGRTLVPLRIVGESFEAKVSWDESTRTVSYRYDGKEIQIQLDSRQALVNGIPVLMDVPPVVVEGRTMVPVRFISEQLGFNVKWDAEEQLITISNLSFR